MIALAALVALLAFAMPSSAGAGQDGPPVAVEAGSPAAAVAWALTGANARAEVGEPRLTSGSDCHPAGWAALRPVAVSGQTALRFTGATAAGVPCQGFAWAPVRVLAPAAIASRAIQAGEPLDGAVRVAEAELRPGHRPLAELPAGAVATRAIAPGQPIDASAMRVGPEPGAPIAVLVRSGALTVEQPGRAIPCVRGLACARLPSGRRVEGHMAAGRLLVELP